MHIYMQGGLKTEEPLNERLPFFVCRGSGIRTHDLLLPKQAR